MSFDYQVLGKKLKEARKGLLIEPIEVAEYLTIGVDDYHQIESGQKPVTGDQILRLASFYQRDFRYFVTGDYPSAESQIQELFRQNANLSKNDRLAIQEFIRLCEQECFLEKSIFNIQPQILQDYSQYFQHNNYKKQGEEAANLERERLNLGNNPIQNIFDLMRNQGIHVFKRQLEDSNISGLYISHPEEDQRELEDSNISGLDINHPEAYYCILINYSDDLYRQNFSAAHEYCHALFDSKLGQEVTYLNNNKIPIEWRANSFAGNFLVPDNAIIHRYQPANDYLGWVTIIKEMCHYFSVSSKVIIIRLFELNWIDQSLKDKLWNDSQLIIKKREKIDPEISSDLSIGSQKRINNIIQQGLSWHLIDLSTKAYQQGEITYQKLLNILDLSFEDGNQLLSDMRVFMEAAE